MKRLACVLSAAALLAAGCASPGRFACIDLDFRTPEQIEASKDADCAPFNGGDKVQSTTAKALPLVWWQALFAMISDLECRVRFVSVEWGGE